MHVEGDVFRRFVVSGREEMTPGPSAQALEQLRLRYRLAAAAADAYFDAGFTVAWDDVVSTELLPECVALLRSRPVHVVVLAPRADVVAARDAARLATGYAAWSVEALRAAFVGASAPGLWLDTSEQTPDETVDAIIAALGD